MLSNHLILCGPFLLLCSIFPSIRVFSNESILQIRWPKYWNFSFSISLSNEYSGLISFRTDFRLNNVALHVWITFCLFVHPWYMDCLHTWIIYSLHRVAQTIKNLPAMQETRVQFLGGEDPLENGTATHSSIPAWRIPWIEEPGGLQFMGPKRVGHDWATNTFTFTLSTTW